MSTFSHTDWTVICNGAEDDGRPCMEQGRTDTFDLHDGSSAADVRAILKRRGWAVNVPQGGRRYDSAGRPIRQQRLDFCPKHKPVRGEG